MAAPSTPMEIAPPTSTTPTEKGNGRYPSRGTRFQFDLKPTKKPKMDPEGFQTPRNTAKAFVFTGPKPINTSNTFDELPEMELDSAVSSRPKRKGKGPPKQHQDAAPLRAMPIKVFRATIQEIRNIISPLTLSEPPVFSTLKNPEDRQKSIIQIFPKASEDKEKIAEALKTRGIECFSHCERGERRKLYVLKGHTPISPEELLNTLKEQKIPAKTASQIGRSSDDPIFLVGFEKDSISIDVLVNQHRIIGDLRVKWEKHKPKKKRYIQCANCQRWGHGKANCAMRSRCIKCKGVHEVGACTRVTKDEGEPFCVNCQKPGHPANSTSCEVYKRHVAGIEQRKKKIQQQQPIRFNSTPAPWASKDIEQHFPELPHRQGINDHRPKAATTGEYRTSSTQPRNNPQIQPRGNLGESRSMRDEILGLPGMAETLNLYRDFISDFRAAQGRDKLKVLIKYDLQDLLTSWV
jgi:hypothetical protein